MLIYILSADGSPLMPTYNIRKVRHMLKDGRAVIVHRKAGFTIQLTYALKKQEKPHTQPVELCEDTGQKHIGVSVKSEKHEFAHMQFDPLQNEKQHHDDCRKYRRTRRNRKRYRKPRFNNRKKSKGWIAPSLRHIADVHENIVRQFAQVLPLTDVTLETGSFDTQMLEAKEQGKGLPQGKDYQHGPRYKISTLRKAVFFRDGYTCQCCGKSSFKDGKPTGVILRAHHALFWKGDHTNRLSSLMTVCTKCHTASNHKKGGKLWGLQPKSKSLAGAAFMNTVRWNLFEELRAEFPNIVFHNTWGAMTSLKRHNLCISKTHANDAYAMGHFHPKHRAKQVHLKKQRRNNRVLSKFYDATYTDVRDGKTKKGSELSCGRTNRSVPRNNSENQRIYRGEKKRKGRVSTRTGHYDLQPGDVVLYRKKKYAVKGVHNNGTRAILENGQSVALSKLKLISRNGGWCEIHD